METGIFDRLASTANLRVRIEVFPERDGNIAFRAVHNIEKLQVRIEVFPERDGNLLSCRIDQLS